MRRQILRCKSSNEFSSRYYQWALKDAEREVRANFPFVSRVQGRTALKFLAAIEPLSLEQQLTYALTLVRHAFRQELENTNEYFQDEEYLLWRQFIGKTKAAERRLHQQNAYPHPAEVDFKELRKYIEFEFSKLFDGITVSDGNNRFGYRRLVTVWNVDTHIFLGGRAKLAYMHIVSPISETNLRVEPLENPEFLRWLGIGQTTWDFITNQDIAILNEL